MVNKGKIDELIWHTCWGDKGWLERNYVDVTYKKPYAILNYRQHWPRTEVNRFTRGTVIHERGEVVSLPFVRFFNHGEKDAVPVEYPALAVEKLDGCLLGLFFEGSLDKPVWHTRRMISSHKEDMAMEVRPFRDEIGVEDDRVLLRVAEGYIKKLRFAPEDCNRCYAFELVDPLTRVVTRYARDHCGLYLIGGRDKGSLSELPESELMRIGGRMNALRPKSYVVNSLEEAQGLMVRYPEDFEGFVIRDSSGQRIKVKSPSYVLRHKLLGKTSYESLVQAWLEGERDEIESYLSETKKKFDQITSSFGMRVHYIANRVRHWQGQLLTRKALAQTMPRREMYRWNVALIYKLIDTNPSDLTAQTEALLKKLSPKRLCEILGLQDQPDVEEITHHEPKGPTPGLE